MTAWKPGDVGAIDLGGCGWRRAMVQDFSPLMWSDEEGAGWSVSETDARALVVIDPEDRSQVDKLMAWYRLNFGGYESVNAKSVEASIDAMQAALRSLVPQPKPDEPAGLGAVVVDQNDITYVLAGRLSSEGFELPDKWRAIDGPIVGDWKNWHQIDVKQVLSEGVTG